MGIWGPWSGPVRWMEITTGGQPGRPICRERHPLQNNRRRWPGPWPGWRDAGWGCTGVLRHEVCAEGAGRGSAAVGRLIGGREALWVAGCQRLRVAPPGCGLPLEGSKHRRMGRQACRAIANGLAAPGADLWNGTAAEAGGAWLGCGPQAACWLSQVLRSSGPWKSSRATERASSALRGRAWMRACWLGVRAPQRS